MNMKKTVALICLAAVLFSLAIKDYRGAKAGSDTVTYNLGSNADISYKKDENKVYYTRSHYSSGSGIRYYTAYFVISLKKADLNDDLSRLKDSGNDYSIIIPVSLSDTSVTESEAEKDADFYWYDSEPNDEGYMKTTYVIDGSIFLQLLDEAEAKGKKGDVYIHHVFAVTGGSDTDSWHKKYGVVNDEPYYRYKDLMKLGWNNTSATQDSQKSCLNIPVPYKRPKTVTPTPTPSPTPKPTPAPVKPEKPTPSPTPKPSGRPTGTPTPSSQKPTATSVPQNKVTPSVNPSPGPTKQPKVSQTPTGQPKASPTPANRPKASPTPSPTPTPRPDIVLLSFSDDYGYVQYLYADESSTQLVQKENGTGTLRLGIENYDTDVKVSFPFDVYNEGGKFIPAYTWDEFYTYYRVDGDVDEGRYTIRAAAMDTQTGYTTTSDETIVELSGRLYGLKLLDVNSDASEWKGVFRTNGKKKYLYPFEYTDGTGDDVFSASKSYTYTVGVCDENGLVSGRTEKYTLPLVDGSTPLNVAGGMLKSGYTWTFGITTSGSRMKESGAHIVIVPTFTYIEQETGNHKNSGISDWTDRERVCIYGRDLKRIDAVIEARPAGRNGNTTEWIFEYSLPDVWYCCSESEDIVSYIEKKGGVSFKEDFWKKEGFVAVSFMIGAYDSDGRLIMTYSNTEENRRKGMCDMWQTEGFAEKKTDCYDNTFKLKEGDVVLLRIPGSTLDRNGIPSPPTNSSEDKTITHEINRPGK